MISKINFKKAAIATAILSLSAGASASVLTSIKPLGFISAAIADGVTDTQILVPEGASPHDYSLKPSDIQKIKSAELVVWIGEDVDMFLDSTLDNNVSSEKLVTISKISDIDDSMLIKGHHHHHHHGEGMEEDHDHEHGAKHEEHDHEHGAKHEEHDHDHEHGAKHEEHDHEHGAKHEEHDHDHEHGAKHEEHDHDHEHGAKHEEHEHEGHDHHGINWHIWTSADISTLVAKDIAKKLTVLYPNKKERIEKNLTEFKRTLDKKNAKLKKELAKVNDKGFYVFHDAYGYFNNAYGLKQVGYFTINPLTPPGAKTIAHIKEEIEEHKVQCLFAEPQFTPKVIESLSQATGVKVGRLDPLGTNIRLGKHSYVKFLQSMADSYIDCLK
ncbi:zinc transport system substrate-binding protein [Bisgaardia hudsonensis]|uniref:High-affinity zinc uptake system protein ZnuA n=1 Tax=Bisgaardia hudsonensis TaxID=109472 RepID=A0A4R2N0C1_9PAST|nr:zinc ABC transporter substrate-binding protein ZnuA [Bisgaardia hudsonensis]TCP12844.1 zinc transport system substrate-binding protein [Bisgaardia hudsonensis]